MRPHTQELIQKYNVPAPRYTSYPTIPLWENNLNEGKWINLVKKSYQAFGDQEGITLYIHLPYCESLCTYCGCNKRITKNHAVELPFISSVMKEWKAYLAILPDQPKLAGIHLGGGTPTFFSPDSLQILLEFIMESCTILDEAEFSFEGHPNSTSKAHLQTLFDLGFRRVSFGIQDFDPEIQKAIHRIQTFDQVKEATEIARQIGFTSINYDLIYGLPHQTLDSIGDTFEKVGFLKPNRIAFYSYAHLPSAFPSQKSFEQFLPEESVKRSLYDKGKNLLSQMGYSEIGMDHFALSEDPLYLAKENKSLHRNFMGYTTSPSKILLGLGNSSISDIFFAYSQNTKSVDLYKEQVGLGHFAMSKGHIMTQEDIQRKKLILDLICNQETKWEQSLLGQLPELSYRELLSFQEEGLIRFGSNGMKVTDAGMPFIRNICMVFDQRLSESQFEKFGFSKAI